MSKPEWGVKRTCLSCGARFYDLQRVPVICPKCDAEFDTTVLQKPKRLRPAAAAKVAAKVAPEKDEALIDDDDVVSDTDTDDDDDEVVIDTDDLDDSDIVVDSNDDDSDDDVIAVKQGDDSLLVDEDDDPDIVKIETGDEELKDN